MECNVIFMLQTIFPSLKLKLALHKLSMHISCIHYCQVTYGLCAIWSLNYLCQLVLYGQVTFIALI